MVIFEVTVIFAGFLCFDQSDLFYICKTKNSMKDIIYCPTLTTPTDDYNSIKHMYALCSHSCWYAQYTGRPQREYTVDTHIQ